MLRLRAEVCGLVQGVGFRPFVYRLATRLGLTGWVKNSPRGAIIEAEGDAGKLADFLRLLTEERPPLCVIHSLEPSYDAPVGSTAFAVAESEAEGPRTAWVLPDLATCNDCLHELFDPADRRYRYPFTNCTHCGPRFSIIEALPYDRARTTMRHFVMCADCRAEYEDPAERRFHAQPNACPECGPQLELWDAAGKSLAWRDDALRQTADRLRQGQVVAVKGLGGFHLMTDARDEAAVRRLRRRKGRDEKPLALMVPDVSTLRLHCEVSALEERLLCGPQAPIVLLRRKLVAADDLGGVAAAVAPANPYLGVMLPYTPLHHLLLAELGAPVVATSGNRSDEPICTDEREAVARLGEIADVFLVHNRPIVRHVDDSVVRVVLGQEMVLRRARGYAPLPVTVPDDMPPLLATGAHLKNTVAVACGREVFLSQHVGDLETAPAFEAHRRVAADLPRLYNLKPQAVACDAHPAYLSTRLAEELGLPVVRVQHHHAHVLACAAENGLRGPVLGVAWDGTGYGPDGTVWGGEFLPVTQNGYRRLAHFRLFGLPGGDRAAREPRRAALGLLHELFGSQALARTDLAPVRAFTPAELNVLGAMLERDVCTPRTSSAGRLFDAVAALIGLRQLSRFEGQAAMDLEFALAGFAVEDCYPFVVNTEGVIDWEPTVLAILQDLERSEPGGHIAATFHNTLAEIIVAVARRAGEEQIVLTGGCFQNIYLLTRAVERLVAEGFRTFWHRQVPPNDGGIALGQIMAASRQLRNGPQITSPILH